MRPQCARRLLDLPSRSRLAGLPPPKNLVFPKAPRPLAATSQGQDKGLSRVWLVRGEDRSLSLVSVLPQDLPETPRNLREKG